MRSLLQTAVLVGTLSAVPGLLLPISLRAEELPGAPAVPSVTIPPVPVAPEDAPFLAQVAGRAAVADAANACRIAPTLAYRATWRVVTRETNSKRNVQTGTETMDFERKAQHLSLGSEVYDGKNALRSAAHFVSEGTTLLTAHYIPVKPRPSETPTPDRTFFQIPIEGDVETLTDALYLAWIGDAPLTQVARWALLSSVENGGYGWRGRGSFSTDADGSVTERLLVDTNPQRAIVVTRRYRLARQTRLPLSIEEWTERTDAGKPGTRTVYRQESFTYTLTRPARTDRFVTKPAPGYSETSIPSDRRLPDLPGPDASDAKSLALLSRWQRAWSRFTAYQAKILVTTRMQPNTAESRPIPPRDAEQERSLQLYYRRPGKLYIASSIDTPTAPVNGDRRQRFPVIGPQTAISDGQTLAVYEGERQDRARGQEAINGDDTLLRDRLRRTGFDDRVDALSWLFDGPQSLLNAVENAEYRGALPLPSGGSAEAVTLQQTFTTNGALRRQRGGQRTTGDTIQTVTTTIYFDDKTGLPLRIERYISTKRATALERDQPPNRFLAIDFTDVHLNEETSAGIFTLPKKVPH